MDLTPGSRWVSAVCSTEVIVVRLPAHDIELRCGGAAMTPSGTGQPSAAPAPDHARGTAMGKRFADPESGLELLCVAPGDGSLSIDDEPLELKDAKPLPSSD